MDPRSPHGPPPAARPQPVSDASELKEVVRSVTAAFRRHQVPYFVTGSLASSVHGEFRATNDFDVVVLLDRSMLRAMMADLAAEFVADADQAEAALAAGTGFNLLHYATSLKVDLYPCRTAFDREAMARALETAPPGFDEPLRIATKEDILLAKLSW